MAEERLQKILAQAGYGSRRSCEEIITAGRVRVNGQPVILGSKADPTKDRITVDGQTVKKPENFVYFALYKPRGFISAVTSPDPRPTVLDLVPAKEHVYPVGRLDVDSEGLILLTNDGELANRLAHPRYEHEKEYRVLVARRPDEEQLNNWRRGIVLEDGHRTAPVQLIVESTLGKGAWLRVIMHEGRKRQIRETASLLGLPVVRIIRVRIGALLLGNLKPKEWRPLTEAELTALRQGKRQPMRPPVRSPERPPARPSGRQPERPSERSSARPSGRSPARPSGQPSGRTSDRRPAGRATKPVKRKAR